MKASGWLTLIPRTSMEKPQATQSPDQNRSRCQAIELFAGLRSVGESTLRHAAGRTPPTRGDAPVGRVSLSLVRGGCLPTRPPRQPVLQSGSEPMRNAPPLANSADRDWRPAESQLCPLHRPCERLDFDFVEASRQPPAPRCRCSKSPISSAHPDARHPEPATHGERGWTAIESPIL